MTSIPEKNFLVKLELDGKELLLNLEVKNTTARCVNSSDPEFKAMQGSIRRTQNGVFLVRAQERIPGVESALDLSKGWQCRDQRSSRTAVNSRAPCQSRAIPCNLRRNPEPAKPGRAWERRSLSAARLHQPRSTSLGGPRLSDARVGRTDGTHQHVEPQKDCGAPRLSYSFLNCWSKPQTTIGRSGSPAVT